MPKPRRETFVSTTNPGRYIETIDPEGATARIYMRRSPFGRRWHKMSFNAYMALARSTELTGSDLRVFLMIMPSIHNGSMVYVNRTQLAKELGMQASSVSRSVRNLVNAGVLEKLDTMAGRVLRLNPNYAWYGPDNGGHTQAIKDWDRAHAVQ